MAIDTDPKLQNSVIYSVFVRNHTPEGTFRALIPDLPRIKALGTDIVWLMPIHPLGVQARKGSLGSPYANRDYRAVNPEFGTEEDLRALVKAIHGLGMRCIIDVVYNHTSPDSVLWQEHPEFFYKKPDGTPGNHIGNWSDIIDLDYNVPALWDYQIETLKYWAGIVDGFRCDVASFVPVEFWKKARAEVEKVRPGAIWLGESVHRSFGETCRHEGLYCAKDVDLYAAFDMEYDYDVRETFDAWLEGRAPLMHWLDLLNYQDFVYPDNYNKMRCLENHDTPRIAARVKDRAELENLTALLYFLKGVTLLYGGQERAVTHQPTLFDKDTVDWETDTDLTPLLQKLARIKKDVLSAKDSFHAEADASGNIAVCLRSDRVTEKIGVFPLSGKAGTVKVEAPDGNYVNLIDGKTAAVEGGMLTCDGSPVIFSYPFRSPEKLRVI